MTPELKKLVTERYLGWTDTWGLSLAFAITQSVDKAERIIADAIVALIASEASQTSLSASAVPMGKQPKLPASVNAVRLAAVIWEQAEPQAFRGFGTESFFKMPAIARAISVLKTKARFSRSQIAAALHLQEKQVEDHLENARLLFSAGKPWIAQGPSVTASGTTEDASFSAMWIPECPQWDLSVSDGIDSTTDIQQVFARYVGNDLDPETGSKLHSHLVVCNHCRTSFTQFKQNYLSWVGSIPTLEADHDLRKHLNKVTKMALKIDARVLRGTAPPNPWPGARKLLRGIQLPIVLIGMMFLILLHNLFMKH